MVGHVRPWPLAAWGALVWVKRAPAVVWHVCSCPSDTRAVRRYGKAARPEQFLDEFRQHRHHPHDHLLADFNLLDPQPLTRHQDVQARGALERGSSRHVEESAAVGQRPLAVALGDVVHDGPAILAPTARFVWDQMMWDPPAAAGHVENEAAPEAFRRVAGPPKA